MVEILVAHHIQPQVLSATMAVTLCIASTQEMPTLVRLSQVETIIANIAITTKPNQRYLALRTAAM